MLDELGWQMSEDAYIMALKGEKSCFRNGRVWEGEEGF